jgi:hypothetical protein
MVVMGLMAPPSAMAETLDAERTRIVERWGKKPDNMSEDEWNEVVGTFKKGVATATAKGQEEKQKAREELQRAGDPPLKEVDPELARRLITWGARPHLTLRNVRIVAPGQTGATMVPVMRVAVSQIAAWWVVPTDEEGKASFTLWTSEETQPGA